MPPPTLSAPPPPHAPRPNDGQGEHDLLDYGATSTPLGRCNDNDSPSHGPEMDFETRSRRARLQIALLCYVRMMEPLAFYTIFRYMAQMTKHNDDIPNTDVGFYKCLFQSLFSAVQAGVLIFWGSMADRVGYEFILIIAYFAGPLLGSALADPVSQYPAVFKGVSLFEHFPYALPGMVTGAVCVSGAAITVLLIDDSRKVYKEEPDTASGEREDFQGHHRPSTGKLIKALGVIRVLCTLSHVRLLESSMIAVSTTALYRPVRATRDGILRTPGSYVNYGAGSLRGNLAAFVFPFLHRRVDLSAIIFPWVFADYGFLNELLRNGSEVARAWYWVGLEGSVLLGPGVLMASASGELALQNGSPDPQVLGTLNAVAESCSSVVKL
ncbi:MAG: hypothetical protein Q9185_002765 [Variospora sp. 1 TL-2023]